MLTAASLNATIHLIELLFCLSAPCVECLAQVDSEWDGLTASQPQQSVFVVHFVAELPPLATRTYFLHLSPRPHQPAASLTEHSATIVYSQYNKAGRQPAQTSADARRTPTANAKTASSSLGVRSSMVTVIVLLGSAADAVQSRYVLYRDSTSADITIDNALLRSHTVRLTPIDHSAHLLALF